VPCLYAGAVSTVLCVIGTRFSLSHAGPFHAGAQWHAPFTQSPLREQSNDVLQAASAATAAQRDANVETRMKTLV
jgi:hypothetical protein